MHPLDPVPTTSSPSVLANLTEAVSDPTGVQTFARYLWQAKQAVRQWLTCLSERSGPHVIICEHIEDMVLVFQNSVRFLQLKTRDRGSWSASIMCDEGLDSLSRAYRQAREVGIHIYGQFELWVEGPISNAKETVLFVDHPPSASRAIRRKLLANGAESEWIDDFLTRLVIRPKPAATRAYRCNRYSGTILYMAIALEART